MNSNSEATRQWMLCNKEGEHEGRVFRQDQMIGEDENGNKIYTPVKNSFKWTQWKKGDLLPYACSYYDGFMTPDGDVLSNMRTQKDQ